MAAPSPVARRRGGGFSELGAEGLLHARNGGAAHTEDGCRLFQSGSNPCWKQNGLTESKGAGALGVLRDFLGFIDEVGVDGGFSCHPYMVSNYISS